MRLSKGSIIFLASMIPVLPGVRGIFPHSFFLILLCWSFGSMPVQALYFGLIAILLNFFLFSLYEKFSWFIFFMYCIGPTLYLFFRKANWIPSSSLIRNFIICSLVLGIILTPEGIVSLRGIEGIYKEPSHFGRFVFGALILGACLYDWRWILPGIIILVLNKSASAFVLFAFAYLVSLLSLKIGALGKRVAIGLLAVGCLILLAEIGEVKSSFRFINLIDSWINIAKSQRELLSVQTLQQVGSRRLPQIVVGFTSAIRYPLGQGAGSYSSTMFETSKEVGLDLSSIERYEQKGFDSIKPTSYYSQITYDFGVFGVVAILLFAIYTYRNSRLKKNGITIWAIGHYLLLLHTTTTFPLPWVLLGLAESRWWPYTPKEDDVRGKHGTRDVARRDQLCALGIRKSLNITAVSK